MKRRSFLWLSLSLPLSLSLFAAFTPGCSSDAPEAPSLPTVPAPSDPNSPAPGFGPSPGGSSTPGVVDPVAELHIFGRVDNRDPAGPRFSWPGTQIHARFSGTGVVLHLRDLGTNQFDVSIDGAAPTLLKTNDATEGYTLATGLSDGEHDLVVTRRTEASFGVTQLLDVTSTEGRPLVPTPGPYSRRIEFVGDSISCGYGVLGTDPCPFDADTESEPSAFSGLTAAALQAGHATVGYSGIGAFRDFGGSETDQMPARYTRSLADDPTSTWEYAIPPDVVVVNLGTNDFATGDPGAPFQTAYETFLSFLRTQYPNARIIGALSPMLSDDYPPDAHHRSLARQYIQGAIDARKQAGDTKVLYFEFDLQTGADGYGCDFHPNVTTQKAMSTKLVTFLKQRLGW